MRKVLFVLPAAALMFAAGEVSAQANATVTYEVSAINSISVSGDPAILTVNTATAGQAPNAATDETTTWAITSNEDNKKVTGQLDTAMPTGLTLTLSLAAPGDATSAGAVELTEAAADLVTGMSKVEQADMAVIYSLTATTNAGVVESATKTVTLTIVSGA